MPGAASCWPATRRDDDADLVARARLAAGAGRRPRAQCHGDRAPHQPRARAAGARGARRRRGRGHGYGDLELDLSRGERSRRGRRAEALLVALTGAEDALVVNNGAAAVLLAVAALAGPGRQVIVSRGELVEIGGALRIADVVAQSGARAGGGGHHQPHPRRGLRAAASAPRATGRHPPRPPVQLPHGGFVARPALRELVALGVPGHRRPRLRRARSPSGRCCAASPTCAARSRAGAALTCFSGDKLLGGPAGGDRGRDAEGPVERVPRASAGPGAADRQAVPRRSGGDAGAAPGPGARQARIPVLEMLELAPEVLMARTGELARLTGRHR